MYQHLSSYEGRALVQLIAEQIAPQLARLVNETGAELASIVEGGQPSQLSIEDASQAVLNGVCDLLSLSMTADGAEPECPMLQPHQLANSLLCTEWLTERYNMKPLSEATERAIQQAIDADDTASKPAPDAPAKEV